ncbi:MAG: DNA polymerase I [Candidatus Dormibacteria bacterium]
MPEEGAAQSPRLVLLDGHSLIYRAFFALPGMSTAKGEPTNAVYGFTAMLILVLAERPDHLAVCLDRAAPTLRKQEVESYKAHRRPMPDDLRAQIGRVREIIEIFGIPIYEMDGYEADDLIATLAGQASKAGLRVRVVTGDLDALQLVDDRVEVQVTSRGVTDTRVYREAEVLERYGLRPEQLPEFKALTGDTSDNIPGVPGVGDKTASRLLQEQGSLEGLIAAIPSLKPGKVTDALAAHVDQMRVSRRLATVMRDCPVTLDLEASRHRGFDFAEVKRVFDDLEFRALLARLPGDEPAKVSDPPAPAPGALQDAFEFEVTTGNPAGPVETVDAVGAAGFAGRAANGSLGIHLLVDGPARGGRLTGIGLGGMEAAVYLPTPDAAALEAALGALRPVLADPATRLAGHDLKNVHLALTPLGVHLGASAFDTYIAAHLTGQGRREPAIELLARDLLGLEVPGVEATFGRGRNQLTAAQLPGPQAAAFAGSRAQAAAGVAARLGPAIAAQGLTDLFRDVEMPLLEVLADMELAGVALDLDLLAAVSAEVGEQAARLEREIWAAAGYEFNVNSTQKLATLLYEELGLPTNRKIKTGYSTDAATLEGLRDRHPVIDQVLEFRNLTKLRSTYLDALPLLVDPVTGRVHTSFNQTVAATGRLSSSNPNLQNIPIRSALGRRIRRAFVPGVPGDLLLSADYSQIELRVLAHFSEDESLCRAFASGEDIHRATAAAVFKAPLADVTSDQRRMAKVVNFGLLYGMGDQRLARDMGISSAEAKAFIDGYFGTFSRVRQYLEATREEAHRLGFVTTLFNRRRQIPDIHSPNRQLRSAAERMAINMPIQGTAADILKVAMVRLHRELPAAGLSARMILSVHDELVFEVPPAETAATAELVRRVMGEAATLRVPLDVEVSAGPNWGETEPVGRGLAGVNA